MKTQSYREKIDRLEKKIHHQREEIRNLRKIVAKCTRQKERDDNIYEFRETVKDMEYQILVLSDQLEKRNGA